VSMGCHEVRDQLPFYAAGTIPAEQRSAIADHLASCPDCRAEVALWSAVGDQVTAEDRRLPAPSKAVLLGALDRVRRERQRVSAPMRLWQLLRAQVPLVRRSLWPASAVIMAASCLLSLGLPQGGPILLAMVAPLVAAAGVAMIYGPENDPALELALATPTSPRQVLLARLALVYGYDLALALAGSLALSAFGGPAYALRGLVLSWLGPMTLLSALALTLSLWIGATNGATVSFLFWLARWLLPAPGAAHALALPVPGLATLAAALELLAGSAPIQFGLAALLLSLGLWRVGQATVPGRTWA